MKWFNWLFSASSADKDFVYSAYLSFSCVNDITVLTFWTLVDIHTVYVGSFYEVLLAVATPVWVVLANGVHLYEQTIDDKSHYKQIFF